VELAEKFGVTQAAVHNWESGNTEPREKTREKVERFIAQWEESSDEEGDRNREGIEGIDEDGDGAEVMDGGSFSSWVTEARARAGLTRQELARAAGLSGQAIYLIEAGKIGNPRQSTVRALVKALGASPSEEVEEEIEESGQVQGLGEFRDFNPHEPDDVPAVPGVYVFYDVSDRPIYVGKASSIRTRVRDHSSRFWFKLPILQTAAYVEISDAKLRDQVETLLIKFLKKNAILNKNKLHHEQDSDVD
jgi:transcriptional regulator with XRE-family HTH domain